MHDQEKSDSAIVAVKSPNKTGFPVAEAMERRAGQGKRGSAKHAPDADPGPRDPGAGPRTASRSALRRQTPKVGVGCSNRARPDLCEGCSAMSIPTANLDPNRSPHLGNGASGV
jgi:hypothetical protein